MIQTLAATLLALLPDFAIIVLGVLLSHRIEKSAWRAFDWLNFNIFFPALLFVAASQRPIALEMLFSVGLSAWCIMALGLCLGFAARRFGPRCYLDFAGAWQTTWRFNTALGFVAVQALPDSIVGLLATAIGMAVPLANFFAVSALAHGNRLSRLQAAREIAGNPFLLASLAGVLVGVSGFAPPQILASMASRLADAALPLMLLSIGAALDGAKVLQVDRFGLSLHLVKLVVLPAVVFAAGLVIDEQRSLLATLLLFAALPTSSAAHILASKYGADRKLVAALVTQSSFFGCITLPLWTLIAQGWMLG